MMRISGADTSVYLRLKPRLVTVSLRGSLCNSPFEINSYANFHIHNKFRIVL